MLNGNPGSKAVRTTENDLQGPAAAWNDSVKAARTRINKDLADAGIADAQQLTIQQARKAELEAKVKDADGTRQRKAELLRERGETLKAIASATRRKSRAVEQAAADLMHKLGKRVRVIVEPVGNRTKLEEVLRDVLRGERVREAQIAKLATKSPIQIAEAMRQGVAAVEGLGCAASTATKLCSLSTSDVRRIEEAETPDLVTVQTNFAFSGEGETWISIDEVSPGQRATALLALVLAGGDEPLLIDQPEDDLDNRYIYEEVVSVLARVCESRQVIVATHNANIPVLGDAEMVIALDATRDKASIVVSGGFEDSRVAAHARHILEGGDEAFSARHKRYLAGFSQGGAT